jgi:CheY-like chemotaxis protein
MRMDNLQFGGIALLLADGDAVLRSVVAAAARGAAGDLVVLEAEDGAEAIQLALQERPQLALLDLDTACVGGLEVAVVLRELLPQLRLALYGANPHRHRECARRLGLPLFDKGDLGRATHWLSAQAAGSTDPEPARKLSLVCGGCGYGVCRATPPRRCPMCHGEGRWRRTSAEPVPELT